MNSDELNSFFVLANYRTGNSRVLTKSQAALFEAAELGWPSKLASLMRALPSPVLDRAYDLVARHRYRIFGHYDQCVAPRTRIRDSLSTDEDRFAINLCGDCLPSDRPFAFPDGWRTD